MATQKARSAGWLQSVGLTSLEELVPGGWGLGGELGDYSQLDLAALCLSCLSASTWLCPAGSWTGRRMLGSSQHPSPHSPPQPDHASWE